MANYETVENVGMARLTGIFKGLSDGNRLRIVLALMRHKELCACQITELIQVTGATASRHMGVLISGGLVASRKEGRWVYYRLRREGRGIRALIKWMAGQLSDDPEVARDGETLREITSCQPVDLCRSQRIRTRSGLHQLKGRK